MIITFASAVALLLATVGCTTADDAPAADAGTDAPSVDAGTDTGLATDYLPCLAPEVPGRHGDPCRCAIDCATDTTCEDELADGNPGGRCIRAGPCGTAADCGDRGACESGRCVNPCTTNADCRSGYLCFGTHCLPQCTDDSQCEYGRCDLYTGWCLRPEDRPPGQPNFERCTNNDQCLSRLCLPINPAAPECHSSCEIGVQTCPQDGVCYAPSGNRNVGLCWERCVRGEPCRNPGYRCQTITGTEIAVCRP